MKKFKNFSLAALKPPSIFQAPELIHSLRKGDDENLYNAFKTDVYSLGIIFIRMLFKSEQWGQMSMKLTDEKALKLVIAKLKAEHASNIELFELMERMISFDPAKRPDIEFVDRKMQIFKREGIQNVLDLKFLQETEPNSLKLR